jgi:hypothetical protein
VEGLGCITKVERGGKSHWKKLGSVFTQRYLQHEAAPSLRSFEQLRSRFVRNATTGTISTAAFVDERLVTSGDSSMAGPPLDSAANPIGQARPVCKSELPRPRGTRGTQARPLHARSPWRHDDFSAQVTFQVQSYPRH